MNQTRAIWTLILIVIASTCYAQSAIDSLLIRKEIEPNLLDILTDASGNLWKIYPQKIRRVSDDFGYNDSFSSTLIDANTTIDAKFPLKTLLYHPSQNKINIINSRWGTLTELRLDFLNIHQPSAVHYAYDGTIMILDRYSNQFYKINENGTIKMTTPNPFVIGSNYYFPHKMIDYKLYSLAMDTAYGIFMIDNYGTYMAKYKISNAKIISSDRKLYILENSRLFRLYINQDKVMSRSRKWIPMMRTIESIVKYKGETILRESNTLYYYRDFDKLFDE